MCCCISGDPVEDTAGKIKSFHPDGRDKFQTGMMSAPCVECPYSCCWFMGQFFPMTMGITQCLLRKKVLRGDMDKYQCFQGYFTICCCIKGGSCHEDSCPDLCAFLEGCCCNCVAISASRVYTMEKYNLASDPCDYRLIRINNCLQMLACICSVLAIIDDGFRQIADLINNIADLFYHTISGCMTAQVAHEMNHQTSSLKATRASQVVPERQQQQQQQQPVYAQQQPVYAQQQQPVYAQHQQPVYAQQQQPVYAQQQQPGQQPVYAQQQQPGQQPLYVQQQPVYVQQQPVTAKQMY